MGFLREVFSDSGTGSASRVMTAVHVITACGCLGYVTYHNHAVPDVLTTGGLGAFATVHYAVNAAKNAIAGFSKGGNGASPNPAT
jgi:hypothetical protein